MRHRASLLAAAFLSAIGALAPATARAGIDVVASFAPVHALVSGVMTGVGEPEMLVPGGASPHDYALKPSQAAALAEAEIVFWIGPQLETFLEKPLATLAAGAQSVALIDAEGLERLPRREGGAFEAHAHEEAGQDETDPHVWLDPRNAGAMVRTIAAALERADPANAARYEANAQAMLARLAQLETDVAARVAPARGRPFIVFHDAYQYFERRFGVPAAGSVTVNPEQAPGAERISQLRARIGELGAACVFTEPQFEPKLVSVLVEGTGARTGVLDPEGGATLTPGPDLYFTLLRNLGDSLAGCLGG